MSRTPCFVSALILSIASVGCQSYTTGLQQTHARADETAAIGALHSVLQAQRAYSLSNGGEYGTFTQLVEGGYLDSRFVSGKPTKDYVFTMMVKPKPPDGPEGSYACNADPDGASGRTGRHFYIDSTSANIHINETQAATASDQTTQ